MKTETQSNPELTRLCELIEHLPVAMLTTTDDDGALASRPMAPLAMDGSGALWFFTRIGTEKLERLEAVNLSFSDSAQATYVSLSGHGEIDTDRERIRRLWTSFAKPWFPEGPDSPKLALLKVVPDAAEYWDAPNSKMVRMFAMVASIVAGKPLGLGAHDRLTDLPQRSPHSA